MTIDASEMMLIAELTVNIGLHRVLLEPSLQEIHYLVPETAMLLSKMKEQLALKTGLRSKTLELDDARPVCSIASCSKLSIADDNQVTKSCIQSQYLWAEKLQVRLLESLLEHCWSNELNEVFEAPLIEALARLGACHIDLVSQELYHRKGFVVELALSKLLGRIKSKKYRLDFLRFILSSPTLSFRMLKRKCWDDLFLFYNDNVLTVEIICTNYNIIYGLRNALEVTSGGEVLILLDHCIKSMKTKNRKLINNCIKIYCYFLAYWDSKTIERFLDMEVPNVFYDEEDQEKKCLSEESAKITGAEMLSASFGRHLLHSYMRFATIQLKHLNLVIERLHHQEPELGIRILGLIIGNVPQAIVRMTAIDNYRFSYLCMQLVSKASIIEQLRLADLQVVWTFAKKMIEAKCCHAEMTPDELNAFRSIQQTLFSFILKFEARLFIEPSTRLKSQVYAELFSKLKEIICYIRPQLDEGKRDATLLTEGCPIYHLQNLSSSRESLELATKALTMLDHLLVISDEIKESFDQVTFFELKAFLAELVSWLQSIRDTY
jgi:hypothetical protein